MSNREETSTGGGVGFTGLLTILFIGLKLTGYITWSWLWVLSPLWVGFIVAVLTVFFTAVVAEAKKGQKNV